MALFRGELKSEKCYGLIQDIPIQDRKLYNLRHTFASQLVSKGKDLNWISKT